MFEIEIKARVRDMKSLRQALIAAGCVFASPVTQKDRIFVPVTVSEFPVPSGVNVLRVREQNGKFEVNLKQPRTNELDCLEVEFPAEKPEQIFEMFRILGFKEFSRVSKVREKGKLRDLVVCLDAVEGLGEFIELEKMAESGDPVSLQEELFKILKEFGVTEKDQVNHGYDILLMEKGIDGGFPR